MPHDGFELGPERTIIGLQGATAEAQLAESVGFDSCMITEHHQQPDGYFPNPLMVAAGIARETTTLKVGTRMIGLILDYRLRSWRRRGDRG